MADRILTLRELNRATLARQMLLERETVSIPAAIERLVGLQGQAPMPPYVGLWTRLQDFKRDDLAKLIADHTVVRATFIRATLHYVTAADYLLLRATIQRALDHAFEAIFKQGLGEGLDMDKALGLARTFLAEKPRSFAEITAMFDKLVPDVDPRAVRYGTRMQLPLIQVPDNSRWTFPGNPKFTLAESWLGKPIPSEDRLRTLVHRYLAVFGPASFKDMEAWSGIVKLKDEFEKLKPDLVIYRDDQKRELFDLPDAPLPDADTPAPIRFLPEFDNLLLSHSKRTRVLADAHRKKVYLPGLRVAATFLIDGFVAGVWKIEKKKGIATIMIEPFAPLSKQDRKALEEEGERLVRFVESDAKTYEVRFSD